MLDKLKQLEVKAAELEFDRYERKRLTDQVVEYAEKFLRDLPEKKVFRTPDSGENSPLHEPFSEQPARLEHLLDILDCEVNRTGLNPASGGHLGYIPGGGLYPSALGDLLAAVTNRYAGIFFSSPGAVRMENSCIRWMCDLVGFPKDSAGNLTSGGSMATTIALVTARDSRGLRSRDFERTVIYTTRQVHHSMLKGLRFIGMGDAVVREIEMDVQFRMRPDKLEQRIKGDRRDGLIPFMIVGSAGTTDAGAIDPLSDLSKLANRHDLWFHVDAAYGGFFLLTEQGRERLAGIGRADSVIIDPHKGLFIPYGTGAVLIRDGEHLYRSQHMEADYMQDTLRATEEYSPADLSPELSKHFRGLRMWLPLKLFGLAPFRAALEEKLLLARFFYREVRQIEGIETGPEPELSVLLFRYLPKKGDANDFNRELIREIQQDGTVFLSSTTIGGRFFLRLAVLSFRTHLSHIQRALEILRKKIQLVKNRHQP